MCYPVIETSSVLPPKSSVIFGNLRQSSEIFGNDFLAFGQLFENLRKSSESVRKSSENRQKIVISSVFNSISHSFATLAREILS